VKIGYYSPLPPERSGIADYSALLLPALERHLEVEVVRPRRRLRRPSYDVGLFHVGNNADAHGWIVEALRGRPGLVVLHEFVLHHLIAAMTLGRGDTGGYLDAMQREAGVVGRLLAHGVADGLVEPLWERRAADFPLAQEVLGHAAGLVVHSRYVEERARAAGFSRPIWRIPHPAWTPPAVEPYRLEPAGEPVVAALGNLNPSKRLPQLLDAFVGLRRERPKARLLIAGGVAGVDLEGELAGRGLADAAVVLGHVDEHELWALLAAADIAVSLRSPTMGETSGIAVRALAAGKPLVVSDVGWFAELPEDAVVKVPAGEGEVEALAAALLRLAADSGLRQRLGEAAARLARTEHALDRVAALYAAACEEAAGQRLVEDDVLHRVGEAAVEVGLDAASPALREVATAAREVTRGR
jgi:glycosyltransferase involved in cell wall biosynthesis